MLQCIHNYSPQIENLNIRQKKVKKKSSLISNKVLYGVHPYILVPSINNYVCEHIFHFYWSISVPCKSVFIGNGSLHNHYNLQDINKQFANCIVFVLYIQLYCICNTCISNWVQYSPPTGLHGMRLEIIILPPTAPL